LSFLAILDGIQNRAALQLPFAVARLDERHECLFHASEFIDPMINVSDFRSGAVFHLTASGQGIELEFQQFLDFPQGESQPLRLLDESQACDRFRLVLSVAGRTSRWFF